MSFLVDPPLLVGAGAAIQRLAPDAASARWAERGVVALFLAVSGLLYVDAPITRPMWTALRSRSGRDWMINSGILRIDTAPSPTRHHLAAAALFALYPSWLRLGRRIGRGRAQTSS